MSSRLGWIVAIGCVLDIAKWGKVVRTAGVKIE